MAAEPEPEPEPHRELEDPDPPFRIETNGHPVGKVCLRRGVGWGSAHGFEAVCAFTKLTRLELCAPHNTLESWLMCRMQGTSILALRCTKCATMTRSTTIKNFCCNGRASAGCACRSRRLRLARPSARKHIADLLARPGVFKLEVAEEHWSETVEREGAATVGVVCLFCGARARLAPVSLARTEAAAHCSACNARAPPR